MLDMRRLRMLHAVSAHGSVTAVSQQLAALEREAGLPLTERAGRGIALAAFPSAAATMVAAAWAALARSAPHAQLGPGGARRLA
jgi:DNA-binding transcriptional LysR family regulator